MLAESRRFVKDGSGWVQVLWLPSRGFEPAAAGVGLPREGCVSAIGLMDPDEGRFYNAI